MLLLVFDALPVVALPPFVLPETLDEPDVADCSLLVVRQMLLSLLTSTDVLLMLTTLLSECGPVSEIVPVFEPLPPPTIVMFGAVLVR